MNKTNKSAFGYSALAIAALSLWAGGAQAAMTSFLNTTGGLYSTGVQSGGGLLIDNNSDAHYSYAAGTGTNGTGNQTAVAYSSALGGSFANATAVTSSGIDNLGFSSTQWVGYNTTGNSSTWVSVGNSASSTPSLNSYFLYRTTFSLTGLNLNSIDIEGQWASDNRGRGIFVNGIQVATLGIYGGGAGSAAYNANGGNGVLTSFSITSSMLSGLGGSFNNGVNTIEFLLLNNNDSATGLRVEFSKADGIVPEPLSLVTFAVGLAGIAAMRYRKA